MEMEPNDLTRIRELFDRIARVAAAEEWNDKLNPAQHSALAYLARANRFSRAPSNVADYLCTTRGTASQTLKALERKGLVMQTRSDTDKRSISCDVTKKGRAALGATNVFDAALDALSASEVAALTQLLEATGHRMLKQRRFRTFGVCKTCRYHRHTQDGLACALLDMPLTQMNANELCHEHDLPVTIGRSMA